ncbi:MULTISPECIES: glycogen debranching protein GlgX [Caballeronia]|uniref:glycogen debranching protein GlgX n=1 Tax=Caballeronia TaxID=1827195 RepID=UPI00158D13EB|nr:MULTISPECIES: glycogen debranching protein GlgX [Caballeronia]MCG7400920.1 glycogen debranching protein GlgX [Caballeronia zhejiangensis]MCI1043424.1 glycogen debranching protein GlgX [Caballeronia zhejiangensis]
MSDVPAVAHDHAGYRTRTGSRFPLGATVMPGGVNFCAFCRRATRVELLLYASEESVEPFQVIALTSETNRTYFFWHVFVEDLPLRCCYTWRAYGPLDVPQMSDEAASRKELLDPQARGVSDRFYDRAQAAAVHAAEHASLRGIVTEPLNRPVDDVDIRTLDDAIIYELHVGGFTRHASSGVRHPGTFAGLIEKIPYLKALGVTHVELLPVMAFDEQDLPAFAAERGLRNYWGYSTYGFYSPHPRYCVEPARAPQEFRELVDALHAADIRVLLDVVFNHTSEAGNNGPLIHFKVFANDAFYQSDPNDSRRYLDYTGCGNTVNCNHPLVSAFIMRCLEYWVRELGVDGFRFDLASVFARGEHGELLRTPPLPWAMEASPILARVPLIAEAWDAGGLYHVGTFPGMDWSEWNGRYRDAIRRFVRGEPGVVGEVCTRIAGSADLYEDDGRLPANSINFVTCHDGFTLADLVSYDAKHNEANGEDNRDGSNDNLSWNCGAEGETDDPAIIQLRLRQARNFIAILLLSQGVPMLLAGDELLRSQRGNNNAFCQDNALSWMDWQLSDDARDMLRFTREMIALRKRHASLRRRRFLTGRPANGQTHPDVAWHGERLDAPAWHDPGARFVAFTLAGRAPGEPMLHIVLNMNDDAREAALPAVDNSSWLRVVDTSAESPNDIVPNVETALVARGACRVEARSVVVLQSR